MSISENIGHQSRTKVTSQIDRVSSFPTKACANAEEEEEKTQREPIPPTSACTIVAVILESEDAQHQYRACDELREELTSLGQKRLWVCAEYLPCRC